MSPFGRGGNDEERARRSAEDRERARLEREAKRAAREGRAPDAAVPAPMEVPPADLVPPGTDLASPPAEGETSHEDELAPRPREPGGEPGETGSHAPFFDADATPETSNFEVAGLQPGDPGFDDEWEEPRGRSDPPATQRDWRAAAGEPDADPPLVRRVPRGSEPTPDPPLDDPFTGATTPQAPAPRIPPPPAPFSKGEKPIGTRRANRLHAPHLGRKAGADAQEEKRGLLGRRAKGASAAATPPARSRRDEALSAAAARAAADNAAHGDGGPVDDAPLDGSGSGGGRFSRGGGSGSSAPPSRRGNLRPGARRPRIGRMVAAIVALAVVVVGAWFVISLFQPFKGDGQGEVTVRIPSGATAGDVGDLLESRGVISSSFFFELRAKIAGKRDDIKAGPHTLKRGMSYMAALDVLAQNPIAPKTVKITIPEGRSRGEVAPLVKKAGIAGDYNGVSATSPTLNPRTYGAPKSIHTLEGFLFPATYELKPTQKASTLVSMQLNAFKDNLAQVDLKRAKKKNLTRYDVLIIASMVEREAGIAKDRRLISAVIYNRLKAGMPLGIDATLRYELHNWTRPLRVSELNKDTPYNTRKRLGLPPTPIGSPGLASLQAAANPANVSYLFYVVKPCGKGAHNFSSTDAQFQKDVAAYDRARAKAGGKSPVDC